MKLLLDENVPRTLSSFFPESFTLRTVPQMGWTGISNGQLLRLAASHEFNALITADQGIANQQNLGRLPIPTVVMQAMHNRLQALQPLVPAVVSVLSGTLRKRIYHVSS